MRVPVKVHNVNPYPVSLYRLQRPATVSFVEPMSMRESPSQKWAQEWWRWGLSRWAKDRTRQLWGSRVSPYP